LVTDFEAAIEEGAQERANAALAMLAEAAATIGLNEVADVASPLMEKSTASVDEIVSLQETIAQSIADAESALVEMGRADNTRSPPASRAA
ncbi:MAG TPA: hypothetical protein VGG12_04635, partial [Methylovirgula sp.]